MTQIQTKRLRNGQTTRSRESALPELHSGDRMTREEFHRIYEKMPDDFKAELIGGTVFVASPLGFDHSKVHIHLGTLLGIYESATPGVDAGDNATLILGPRSEPQPDLFLRILPECGGQTKIARNRYVQGAPELIVEVAFSSRAIDLHKKREDYAQHGVCEYLVASLNDKQIFWFDLRHDTQLPAAKDGIIRVKTFPGLWIDGKATQAGNLNLMLQTLRRGMDSAEHADFVKRLAAKRK